MFLSRFIGLGSLLLCVRLLGDSPLPLRSFLPVNDTLAKAISKQFGVALQAGMYFTDQRTTVLEPAGTLTNGEAGAWFDAGYLERDTFTSMLLGTNPWRTLGLQTVERDAGGVVRIAPVPEFSVRVTWQRARLADGRLGKELWLARRNGEKWLLYWEDEQGVGQANLAFAMPVHFVPARDSVLLLALDEKLSLRRLSGEFTDSFELQSVGAQQGTRSSFRVAHTEIRVTNRLERRPLLYYHPASDSVLFAAHLVDKGKTGGDLIPAPLRVGDPVTVYFMRLSEGKVRPLLRHLRFPFSLSEQGLLRDQRGKKELALMDWSSGELASFAPQTSAPLAQAAQVETAATLRALGSEELSLLAKLGYPEELMTQAWGSSRVPVVYDSEFSGRLLRYVGREADTQAVVLYEEGEAPTEWVLATLKAQAMGAVGPIERSGELKHVFHFPQSLLLGNRRQMELRPALEALRKICEGTSAAIYLEDFPYAGDTPSTEAMNSKLVQALREYETVLGPAISEGKCRILWSIRESLYEKLREHAPNAFGFGGVLQVEVPDGKNRQLIAAMTMRRLGHRYGYFLHPDALEAAFAHLEEEREKSSALKIPALYEAFFLDLIAALKVDGANRSVSRQAVDQFVEQRHSTWQIRDLPWEVSPGNLVGTIPQWVRWHGRELRKANVLTEQQFNLWRENPQLLVRNGRFGFALFRTPSQSNEMPGAVDLLVADGVTRRVLDFDPIVMGLHPKGFYFVQVDRTGELDKREATLAFYEIRPIDEPQDSIQVLRRGIRPTDLSEGKLQIVFENDLVVIERMGAVIGGASDLSAQRVYYGPQGLWKEEEKNE